MTGEQAKARILDAWEALYLDDVAGVLAEVMQQSREEDVLAALRQCETFAYLVGGGDE